MLADTTPSRASSLPQELWKGSEVGGQVAHDTKSNPVATGLWVDVIAVARTGKHRCFAPVVATDAQGVAVGLGPGTAVGGRADVVRVVAVGDPLIDVAVHVVQAKGVGWVAADR